MYEMLKGEAQLATVQNHPEPPYPSYQTYLIRNNQRDADGILISRIKAELVPERWGYDLRAPDGATVATTSRVNGDIQVIEMTKSSSACSQHRITLRAEGNSMVTVLDGMTPIGRITSFPAKMLP